MNHERRSTKTSTKLNNASNDNLVLDFSAWQ